MYFGTRQKDLAQYPQLPMAGLPLTAHLEWMFGQLMGARQFCSPASLFQSQLRRWPVPGRTATEPSIGPPRPVP